MPADTGTPKPTGVSPSPTLECNPIGGAIEPAVCVAGVSVQINEGIPRPVACEEDVILEAGDTLRLVNLQYCTSREAKTDKVAGEAYLYHCDENSSVWVANDDVLYTPSTSSIPAGCGAVGDFRDSWVVEPGQNRVAIALVHYFGNSYEVDDRFHINLHVEQ